MNHICGTPDAFCDVDCVENSLREVKHKMKYDTQSVLVFIMGNDCTNRGVTSGKDSAILLLKPVDKETFKPSPNTPTLELRPRRMSKVPMAVPYGTPEGVYPMFDGHWVYTSDSRFPFEHPIPVHDRFETAKENAVYSA
jgi:hypothetical protein